MTIKSHTQSDIHTTAQVRVLLVEDSEPDAELVREYLSEVEGEVFELARVTSMAEATLVLESQVVDIVLLDLTLPDADGLQGLHSLHMCKPRVPIVPLTGLNDQRLALEAVREGAQDYLLKDDIDGHILSRVIRYAIERQAAQDKIAALNAELAKLIEIRTARLAMVDNELATFAHSLAHDIRQPLRAMQGYSKHLLDGYLDFLDEEGRHSLTRIEAGSRRLWDLLDGLLSLSRVTRSGMRDEKVDLSEIAADLIDEFQDTDPGRKVATEVAEGMTVYGDARLLRLALQNLIGNAWKYSAQTEEAEISVGRCRNSGKDAFFVRDNGIGFDSEHADSLFEPFVRLESGPSFEGSGIGLASVQRVVQRHGGEVWAESRPGEGATFYFTIPSHS